MTPAVTPSKASGCDGEIIIVFRHFDDCASSDTVIGQLIEVAQCNDLRKIYQLRDEILKDVPEEDGRSTVYNVIPAGVKAVYSLFDSVAMDKVKVHGDQEVKEQVEDVEAVGVNKPEETGQSAKQQGEKTQKAHGQIKDKKVSTEQKGEKSFGSGTLMIVAKSILILALVFGIGYKLGFDQGSKHVRSSSNNWYQGWRAGSDLSDRLCKRRMERDLDSKSLK